MNANSSPYLVPVRATVGWVRLLRVRGEVKDLADLAEEDPLLRAADRWRTLHKFAPELIEALEFRAARPGDPLPVRPRRYRDRRCLPESQRAEARSEATCGGLARRRAKSGPPQECRRVST